MTILKEERKQILKYLMSLIQNNNREWFQKHKEDYNLMRTNLEQLVIVLGEGLAQIEPNFKYVATTPADTRPGEIPSTQDLTWRLGYG